MSEYLFAPPVASVAIANDDRRLPVRRIFCVGRNYAAHAREMGTDPTKEPPFFFMKPADAVVDSGSVLPYPPETSDLHHEIELVAAIGLGGTDIAREDAVRHIFGYGVGIDLTRRDLQQAARKLGRPWDFGKGFDRSAPCSPILPANGGPIPESGRIWIKVNGAIRQDGNLADMIFPIADIVSLISHSMRLERGDLIFTGTPEGVGPLVPGDVVEGGVDGFGGIAITIT